jgi:peptidoglycan/LPS O-acetylase OafA/YrhL
VHTAWIWTAEQFQLTLHGGVGKLIVGGLLAITLSAAFVLFHFVEEPARRWMRRMVDFSGPNADARTDPAAHPTTGKLQSVDRALEERPKSISARAG